MAQEHAFEHETHVPLAGMSQPVDPTELDRITRERKQLRRLQTMMNMCMQVIDSMHIEEASKMIADCRAAALTMFPGKELAYDLIWKPRFQRLMMERFRLQ